jgi:UDP-N-acetylmuramate dehydrogenase
VAERVTRLAELTTLRLGGPAGRLVEAWTAKDLVAAVAEADAAGTPVLLVAGGSNLVVGDAGFDGTVVRVVTRGVRVDADTCGGAFVTVAAGESWDGLVERAVAEGWSGVEALSGIPGSVGATPVQNVGAYGQEVADTVASVRTWDRVDRVQRTFFAADCGFGYRTSRFKREPDRYVVLEVTFQLPLGDLGAPVRYAELARALGVGVGERVPSSDVRAAVLGLRRGKGMVLDPGDHDTWSAGSFFTNPILREGTVPAAPGWPAGDGLVKLPAAWLIQHAGFGRGHAGPGGRVGLSTKHVLALTNRGAGRTEDLLGLAREVRDGVRDAFGVELHPEPVLVGCAL